MSAETAAMPGAGFETDAPADEYAIVEIMGHRKHVGRIREVARFGATMLQVDVPTEGDFTKGFVSHFYGGAAIFGVTPTDMEMVRRANQPREPYGRYLPPPAGDDDGEVEF